MKCLFENQLATRRARPCLRCKHVVKMGVSAQSYERGSPFKWWTAVNCRGQTLTFRVGKGRTPRGRIKAIRDEYRKTQQANMDHYTDRFDASPRRGKMFANLITNAEFRGGILHFKEMEIRHATPCEVMQWMITHQSDMLTLVDNERMVALMAAFV